MIAKFTTDTPISNKEAEAFIKLAIKDLGEGSEVELFQMGYCGNSGHSNVITSCCNRAINQCLVVIIIE